jgi:hypothetical protein
MLSRRNTAVASLVVALIGALGIGEAAASASAGPGWEVAAHSLPTNMTPGGTGLIVLHVFNVGAADSTGPLTVTDVLPAGVTATYAGGFIRSPQPWDCTGSTVVRCTNDPTNLPTLPGGGGSGVGSGGGVHLASSTPPINIEVTVAPEAVPSTLSNQVSIAGGGAPSAASTTDLLHISPTSAGFGVANWDAWFSNEDGTIDTQAGSHPYAATFDLGFNTVRVRNPFGSSGLSTADFGPAGGEPRNVIVELPPGFVGNPTAVPQCPREMLDGGGEDEIHCPSDTVVGVAVSVPGFIGEAASSIYNMVPPPGVAAEFAFSVINNPVFLDSSPRTGGDNGITTRAYNSPQREVVAAAVTLWGVPGDHSHDAWRCENKETDPCTPESGAGTTPFLTLPTACGAPQPFRVRVTQWEDISVTASSTVDSHDSNGVPVGFTGCESLGFGSSITMAPDTSDADTPAGLTVEVKPQLGGLKEAGGLSTSDIQNTTVTLPQGFVINPGQAAGLQACQPGQDGLTTEAERAEGREDEDPANCPNASKVGTDEIETPLLPHSLKGNVYVLQSNPPELKLLVTASGEGVNLKLVGVVHLNEQTGQLTTTFEGTPELPFTDFKLSFSGGAQAALDTPTQCGTYEANADFTPWSSPFVADALTSAQFGITAGPGGGPCPSSPLPFSPSMVAGSTTDQAGGFTNFSLLLQRGDGQQRIEKLQFKEPAGLAGLISSVPLCPEPQASQGTCSAASHIGHSVVTSGPGPYPLVIPQPGEPEAPIYLTGPYEGAPFGLSIVTPVIAGPFNLGTIVTRARIEVDPHTAQITVTTDPLPQIVKGVPTDLRSINAIIDRPEFLFNPTNCTPAQFTGTATSSQGATAAIASPFGMGSCRSLAFKPKFSASASGRNSKAGGTSLDVKVAYPSAPQGSEANIAKVKVDLPKQLPSRLTTLQKACTAAQFDANPAGCPAASVVGHAIVHTSVLPVPLEGPAYFVSNGGEAFPNLIMVLQGYGVTVDLVGDTFINKAGITSSTFKSVPDVPFNTFELTLPQGPNSALATNVPAKAQYSLCGQKLTMPTELTAQNGVVIDQATPIGIAGCAKKRAVTRSQKLAAALRACHKRARASRRTACEKAAKRKFGSVKKKRK